MINPAQIPDEVVEAAAIDLYRAIHPVPMFYSWDSTPEEMRKPWRNHAIAAIAAALEAWPGMEKKPDHLSYPPWPHIILPLPEVKP